MDGHEVLVLVLSGFASSLVFIPVAFTQQRWGHWVLCGNFVVDGEEYKS